MGLAPRVDLAAEVRAAEARIRPLVLTTPVVPSARLSERVGSPVVLKCEQLQHTGSFKVRGALNKALTLSPGEVQRGLVTASTGNHGAATAYAARLVGAQALVVVPNGANPAKIAVIERLGGRIEVHGHDSVESEHAARELSRERGLTYVSPYNDPAVIGGQGTLGLELLAQVETLSAVFVAVGGGGLAAGVAAAIKARSPATRVIGCSPTASAVMYHSLQAGRILELPSLPTLSDGTAGGVEPGAITLEPLTRLLDAFVLVDESEILEAFVELIEAEHLLVEGSAAMAYAAARRHATARPGATAVVLCGGNVGLGRLAQVIEMAQAKGGQT
jgi:threonine dehydratase